MCEGTGGLGRELLLHPTERRTSRDEVGEGSFCGWVRRRGGGDEGGSHSAAEEAEACKAVASIHPGTGVDWLQERSSVGGWLRELED